MYILSISIALVCEMHEYAYIFLFIWFKWNNFVIIMTHIAIVPKDPSQNSGPPCIIHGKKMVPVTEPLTK